MCFVGHDHVNLEAGMELLPNTLGGCDRVSLEIQLDAMIVQTWR